MPVEGFATRDVLVSLRAQIHRETRYEMYKVRAVHDVDSYRRSKTQIHAIGKRFTHEEKRDTFLHDLLTRMEMTNIFRGTLCGMLILLV